MFAGRTRSRAIRCRKHLRIVSMRAAARRACCRVPTQCAHRFQDAPQKRDDLSHTMEIFTTYRWREHDARLDLGETQGRNQTRRRFHATGDQNQTAETHNIVLRHQRHQPRAALASPPCSRPQSVSLLVSPATNRCVEGGKINRRFAVNPSAREPRDLYEVRMRSLIHRLGSMKGSSADFYATRKYAESIKTLPRA